MKFSKKSKNVCLLFLTGLLFLFLSGCEEDASNENDPLNPDNINLIFVVSSDLDYNAYGDIDSDTANLTPQGLQRVLSMATYLKNDVLGKENVTSIYALSPMTHLQTDKKYPDMNAIGSIQQFALLNRNTVATPPACGYSSYTAYSYPIKTSYTNGSVPEGTWAPSAYCPDCAGLDFNDNDVKNNNLKIARGIIDTNSSGFYVFSAPWETSSDLMYKINRDQRYNLDIPTNYSGPNLVYAISISPDKNARLITYDSKLDPASTYPELPSPVVPAACPNTQQTPADIFLKRGDPGVVIPGNINTNETVYFVRHAEAHPDPKYGFENGNFVGAGQWRALDLANTLSDKINLPDMVYSIDPAQWYSTKSLTPQDYINVSYVRPSLTVWPYAIANDLPFHLVSHFSFIPKDQQATNATDFFFTNGTFSNQTVLVAWESGRIKPIINKLIRRYTTDQIYNATSLNATWPGGDYDTIWTVNIDDNGALTVHNNRCEGIDSEALPEQAPQF